MAIAMEIYEKIRYYRDHTDYSQRSTTQTCNIKIQEFYIPLPPLAEQKRIDEVLKVIG